MKRVVYYFGTLLLGILLMTSCQKLPSLSCKIDGEPFNAVYIPAAYGNVPNVGPGFLIIAGDNMDLTKSRYLALLVRGDKTGTYDLSLTLSGGQAQCAVVYLPGGQNDTLHKYIGQSGTVTISNIDFNKNLISGTFNFTLINENQDTIQLSDGKFDNVLFVNLNNADLSDLDLFNN